MKRLLQPVSLLSRRLFPDSGVERFVFQLFLAVTLVTAVLYAWLPQAFPIHFNRSLEEVDGTMGATWITWGSKGGERQTHVSAEAGQAELVANCQEGAT